MRRRTFGDALRARLGEMEMSQAGLREELARVGCSVSTNTVWNWASGAALPRRGHLLALLDVLLVPTEERDQWKLLAYDAQGDAAESA